MKASKAREITNKNRKQDDNIDHLLVIAYSKIRNAAKKGEYSVDISFSKDDVHNIDVMQNLKNQLDKDGFSIRLNNVETFRQIEISW